LEFYKLKHKIKQDYQLWQEGFHPQAIANEEMFIQKLEYRGFRSYEVLHLPPPRTPLNPPAAGGRKG